MQFEMFSPKITVEVEKKVEHLALKAQSIADFVRALKDGGCGNCKLAHDGRKQIVVFRGNPNAQFMIVGEAPGAVEDSSGLPFSGPAGLKLNQILASIGLDPNKDFYIGNIVKCRPVDHSGIKQNLTPTHECAVACKPFLRKEIELLKPKVIICTGLTSARYLLDLPAKARMRDYSGRIIKDSSGIDVLITYHPAAILHASDRPELCNYIRRRIWDDIKKFKKVYLNETK